MKINDQFTIVIQGPVHPNSIIALSTYNKKFPLIISTWKNDLDEEYYDAIMNGNHSCLLSHDLPDYLQDDGSNRYRQFYTTYKGVCLVETDYIIKIRSDEYYTDLKVLIDKFLEDTDKLVTSNLFFRKFSSHPFHPSDHIYVAKTKKLKNALEMCMNVISYEILQKFKINICSPEQHLAINWILSSGFNLRDEIDNPIQLMKDHFDVVEVKDLGSYCIGFHGKYSHDIDQFFDSNKDIKHIHDL